MEKSETVLNSWNSTNAALPFYMYNIIVEKCVFFMLYNSNENIFKIYMTHTLLHLNNIFPLPSDLKWDRANTW